MQPSRRVFRMVLSKIGQHAENGALVFVQPYENANFQKNDRQDACIIC